MDHLVAVYGTLKRGYGNHQAISHHNGEFILETTTQQPLVLLDGGFPMVVRDTHTSEQARPVHVEVYRVGEQSLAWMDGIEGHPDFYERLPTAVVGVEEDVWLYQVPRHYLDNGVRPPILTGLWDPRNVYGATRDQ